MPHVIAWCGFLGAWLLVAGPLDQAVRELEDQQFEHEAITRAVEQVGDPPRGTTKIRRHRRHRHEAFGRSVGRRPLAGRGPIGPRLR